MEYQLIRSDRRTLSLEITRAGEVIVRAPRHCPQQEIDRLLKIRTEWINKHIESQRQRREQYPEPDQIQQAALIARAQAELPSRVMYYASLMGLKPTGITITGARKRFGSCSYQNRLCFSWRLMQYPDEAVDYVVVHELAHIVHKNHGRQFYALISSFLPDYKVRQKLLRGSASPDHENALT